MFSVVKLGGCNGSGKTTAFRELIKLVGARPGHWQGNKKNPNYYRARYSSKEVYILGSYDNDCGGMDTISDKDERLEFVRWACKPGNIVFFEGLITGKTYGALGALSEEHVRRKRGRWTYAFMDTPFEECARRVLVRREAAGNHNPFDPERTMRPTFDSIELLKLAVQQKRASRAGVIHPHPVLVLPHVMKPATLAKRLLAAGIEGLKS